MSVALFAALLYLGVALQYAADPTSALGALASRRPPRSVGGAILLMLTVAAFALWHQREPGPAALLMVIAGLAAFGTVFALVAPVLPRLTWGLAGLSLVAIPILLSLGAWP